MHNFNNRYWLETEHFLSHNTPNLLPITLIHYSESPTCLSRFEFFLEFQMIGNKTTPLYISQYLDHSITSKEDFKMHTGQRNALKLPEDEHYDRLSTQLISGKLVPDQNFVIIDYEAQLMQKLFILPTMFLKP